MVHHSSRRNTLIIVLKRGAYSIEHDLFIAFMAQDVLEGDDTFISADKRGFPAHWYLTFAVRDFLSPTQLDMLSLWSRNIKAAYLHYGTLSGNYNLEMKWKRRT